MPFPLDAFGHHSTNSAASCWSLLLPRPFPQRVYLAPSLVDADLPCGAAEVATRMCRCTCLLCPGFEVQRCSCCRVAQPKACWRCPDEPDWDSFDACQRQRDRCQRHLLDLKDVGDEEVVWEMTRSGCPGESLAMPVPPDQSLPGSRLPYHRQRRTGQKASH